MNQLLKLLQPRAEKRRNTTIDDSDSTVKDGILSNGSVIIYVWRQKDAEIVAEQLKGFDVPGGTVCYHGGMDSNSRTKSQGKVRIIYNSSMYLSLHHPYRRSFLSSSTTSLCVERLGYALQL